MTEILDSQGNTIRVGMRVLDENDRPGGTVTEITDPDGDTNSYGQTVGILPRVIVRWDDDGTSDDYPATWNATGPWDDYRDDYTCDDLTVSVIEHGPDCTPADMTEPDEEGIRDCKRCGLWESTDTREPDGQRMTGGGTIVPTDR